MPINPLIAMSGQNVDIANPLNRLLEIQQQKQQNARLDRQEAQQDRIIGLKEKELEANQEKARLEALSERDKNRLKANVIDSVRGLEAYNTGGEAGLVTFLDGNRQRNMQAGIDSNETDQIAQLVAAGRTDEAVRLMQSAVTIGERLDIIKPAPEVKAPTTRERKDNGYVITDEWDPKQGKYVEVGKSPQFAPPAPDNTLVEIADASSPTGTRLVPRAQAVNQPGKPPSGMNVEVGPDGTVRMTQGRGAGGLTNSTQAAVEKSAIDTGSMLSQVRSFADRFNPEFFTYGGRLDRKVKGVRASIDPASLNPEERKKYEEAASYASDLGRVQAQQINELYGAALSAGENERAKAFIVNPEDDPVVAEQKIQGYEKYLRRTQAKLSYIRKNGLSVEGVSVDDMPEIMNNRAREIEAELAKTKAGDDLRKAVSRQLAEEFGLLQ